MKEFSIEELSQYNGENGKPVYISHNGKVYDVSGSKMWKTGTHMKRHRSGQDLTTDIQAAPHAPDRPRALCPDRGSQKGRRGRRPADPARPGRAS